MKKYTKTDWHKFIEAVRENTCYTDEEIWGLLTFYRSERAKMEANK